MISTLLALCLTLPAAEGVPVGNGKCTVSLGGKEVTVHTHRGAAKPDRLVLVFHGTLRNATEYRDWGRVFAKSANAVVAAPEFDAERFPMADYQRGGLLDRNHQLRPKEEWTFSHVRTLAEAMRKQLGRPDLPYSCIGHSAGGQILVRLCTFVDCGAERVVAANPGSLLFPNTTDKYGYGLGGLPNAVANDDTLKRYLAAPLVLYLGTEDTATTKEADEHLDVSAAAIQQGACRFNRGHNAFKAAGALAKERGWKFNWKLVEALGVGHSAEKMFAHPNCANALGVAP